MCTAIKIGGCFGRTLDLEYGYGEQVVLTPREFPLPMRHRPPLTDHYAIVGMATVAEGFPLYYDGVNEHGLGMAGLNFPHSGVYAPARDGDVASFELTVQDRGGGQGTLGGDTGVRYGVFCRLSSHPPALDGGGRHRVCRGGDGGAGVANL